MAAERSRSQTALIVGIIGILALVVLEVYVVLLSVQGASPADHSAGQALVRTLF